MAITKRPGSRTADVPPTEDRERKIEAFIAGANGNAEQEHEPDAKRARVMMRFDPTLLRRVDAAAKRRGVTRTAWLHMVASRALDQGDG
ncbi:MAG TPA: hypothetical protein VEZ12_07310 [Herpetosiphonaceae bacterium]|nr:hypothetical protein [Herpetosiphonaceae bacterium]